MVANSRKTRNYFCALRNIVLTSGLMNETKQSLEPVARYLVRR